MVERKMRRKGVCKEDVKERPPTPPFDGDLATAHIRQSEGHTLRESCAKTIIFLLLLPIRRHGSSDGWGLTGVGEDCSPTDQGSGGQDTQRTGTGR